MQMISLNVKESQSEVNTELFTIGEKNCSNQIFNNRKVIKSIKDSPGDGVHGTIRMGLWENLKRCEEYLCC